MTVITGSKATTEAAGSVRLATIAEAVAGIAEDIAVTPAGVAAIALEGVGGVSQAELNAVQVELDATQQGAGLANNGAYVAPGGSIFIAASSSITNALSLLDTQLDATNTLATSTQLSVLANTNAISTEELRAEGVEQALQLELDATQQGAGLEDDGSFVAPLGANYVGASSSLKEAVSTLDTQLKTVADSVGGDFTEVVDELDATQIGAGLEDDGSLAAPVGSNYLGTITSLKGGLVALDSQVKANEDAIDVESLARALGEANLQDAIDTIEGSVGLEADGSLVAPIGSNYLGAITTIKEGLETLDTQVHTTSQNLTLAVTDLEAADGDLQDELDLTQVGAGLEVNGAYVAPVASNYLGASDSLKGGLVALDTQAKVNADAIASESTARASADSALQGELDLTQASAGLEADGSFIAPIGTTHLGTITNLKAGLEVLDAQVALNAGAISSESTARVNAINAEQARAEGVEQALQLELNATQQGAGLEADGSYVAPLASNYLGATTDLKDALVELDTRVKLIADASGGDFSEVLDEVNEIEASVGLQADGTFVAPLGSNYLGTITTIKGGLVELDAQIKLNEDTIDAEVLDRANADATLQTAIDTIEASVGLQGDGSFVAPVGTSYLGTIANIKSGLVALDTAIGENDLAIANEIIARGNADSALNDLITNVSSDLSTLEGELNATQQGAGLEADGSFTTPVASNYLGASTSLYDAIIKLDTELKANADADATELDLSGLQDELDATQQGAGLEADGSLVAPIGTNYLGTITTIKGGLVELDAQVKVNADAIATEATARANADTTLQLAIDDVQGELDATQLAVGLDANGDFIAIVGSNYLGAVTSVVEGVTTLDTQIKTNADAIDTEASTRASADATLQTAIDDVQDEVDLTQQGAGLEADGSFTALAGSNYLTTASSLKDGLSKLDTQAKVNADAIASEASARANAAATLQTAIDNLQAEVDLTQQGAGLEADGSLVAPLGSNYLGAISTLKGGLEALDAQVKSSADAITTEASSRASADTALQSELDLSQASAGLEANGSYVAPLGSNYLGATTTLKAGLVALDNQAKVNADALVTESTARASADATLQSSIDDVQSELDLTQQGAGLEADGSLIAPLGSNYLGAISTLKGGLVALDSQAKSNANAILSEATSRANADTALQSELDLSQASAGLEANGSYVAPLGSNYLGATTTLKAGLVALDTQAKVNADAIASESTARVSADATLQSSIDDVQSELDGTQLAVGLEANGSYVAPLGSNYLGATTTVLGAISALDAQVGVNEGDIDSLETRVTTIENNPAVNQDAFNILAAREGGVWSQGSGVVIYAPSSIVIRQTYGAWAYDTNNSDFIFTAPSGGPGDRHWQYDSSDSGSIIFTGVA